MGDRAGSFTAMLPVLVKLKVATALMAGWTASSSAAPMPVQATAMLAAVDAAAPIEVSLFDGNYRTSTVVEIERDGSTDEDTAKTIAHVFRCRRTEREKPIAKQTLAMLADLAQRYKKPIEFVSVYRATRDESWESPHRGGRAIDFRIHGERLAEIRDYLWRTYKDVGVGWYPSEGFLHMDTRPKVGDTAWTFVHGVNHYHPYWAEAARRPAADPAPVERKVHARRPGS